MAQSDYELAAHISGLNQRTEINSIFDSILTHNSGSTAPAVTKAFMMWVDTSNATYYYLKMRNHDNTAWVTLFIYTVSTKVITPFIVNSPTANALSKINADGTIGNSNIINDASGNVGIGVPPRAWFGSYTRAIELGASSDGGTIWSSLNQNVSHIGIGANFYYDSILTPRYKANGPANEYNQQNGTHKWYTATSGTAGNAIAWTTAMTLDASGDLAVPHTYSNTTASAANMFIDSTGKFFRSTSSKQYKTDIEDIDNLYVDKFFNNARPVYYKSLSDNDNHNWGYWGFIAEEIAEFDKRLVHWRYDTKEIEVEKEIILEDKTIKKYIEKEIVNDEFKPMIAEGVMYERITVLLTAKVQEQQKIINDLISRIEVLETK